MNVSSHLRDDAFAIWKAGVDAVRPEPLVQAAVASFHEPISAASRILVVGGGKAGAAMGEGLETALQERLDRVTGFLNIPEGTARPLKRIRFHAARPIGVNAPTAAGVVGTEAMRNLLASAASNDLAICLLSGGGSALLPAPVPGVTLEDKQAVTKLLHACGATIGEMNAVRKHLSRIKGGRLTEAFAGRFLLSLIISDVVGDPLDVIASGPTAPDPTTFADALAVLRRYALPDRVPASVMMHLERGARGEIAETPKSLPSTVTNIIVGNNSLALHAARLAAESRGYRVVDLGPNVEGETRNVASGIAERVRSYRDGSESRSLPKCILIGGETTVTLNDSAGKGGRNQEFVLAMLHELREEGMKNVAVLSGGTDGEDGPTDAAGAIATQDTFEIAKRTGLDPETHLRTHNAYPFFEKTNGLIRTGPTNTNVMDLRVILIR